ncbi:MAG: cupredoxin domain-containing protein [Pseudomonadota bacterium]
MIALAAALAGGVALGLAISAADAKTEHKVTMLGSEYAPKALKARVGDVIHFVNDDFTNHAVYSPTLGFGIDLGAQKSDETRTIPLGKAGTFKVLCVFHADMLRTVTVER